MPSNVPLEALFSVGIFETLKVSRGKVVELDRHLERLVASAHSACPSTKLNVAKIRQDLLAAIRKEGLREAYVRFTWLETQNGKGLSFTLVKSPKRIPISFYRRGVSIETGATRRNSLASLSGEFKVREFHNGLLSVLDGLDRKGIFERIYLDRHGYVCEGTISNLFIVKGNTLMTPPRFLGALAGVTRSAVLALGEQEGLDIMERPFTRFELYAAQEAFLTNTSLGILPVTKADARTIGDGKVGPRTKKLMDHYRKEAN